MASSGTLVVPLSVSTFLFSSLSALAILPTLVCSSYIVCSVLQANSFCSFSWSVHPETNSIHSLRSCLAAVEAQREICTKNTLSGRYILDL